MAGFRDIYALTSEDMFLSNLRQDIFSNSTSQFLDPTHSILYFKNSDIFTQIQQKQPCETTVVAGFRDRYAPTSMKYFSTELKRRSFE